MEIEHEASSFRHLTAGEIIDIVHKEDFWAEGKKVSGLFAPLGLSGFGSKSLWMILNKMEDRMEKNSPFFDWYNLITACAGSEAGRRAKGQDRAGTVRT